MNSNLYITLVQQKISVNQKHLENRLTCQNQPKTLTSHWQNMLSSKNIKSNIKKVNSPSLRILHPEEVIEKMSFSQYDEEPTLIFLASNRDSLNSANYRPNSKGHSLQKRQSRLLTYESNLMESSPQRSDSSAVDGEFICKYLTPIKKQQFEQLLFKDEINQNIQNLKTKPTKPSKNQRKSKNIHPNAQNLDKRSITHEKNKNPMYSNMIKSFLPCGSIHETDQNTQSQIKQKHPSTIKLKQIASTTKITSTPSIFIDPNAQVQFLKLNNNELYKKLQAQIDKNSNLEQKINTILAQNKTLSQKNHLQQNIIKHLKQTICKLEQQKREYLAKEWQQFHLVKNILIQKRKQKSKQKINRNSISKSSKFNSKIDLLKKVQKGIFEIKKQEEPKTSGNDQKLSFLRENGESFGRQFSSGKMSLSHNCNTIQSENDKKNNNCPNKRQRKLSFQNNQQPRRYSSKARQRSQVERILQDKLFISEQNRCKKSVRSSPSRKTCRKNGSGPKQNYDSGFKQPKRG